MTIFTYWLIHTESRRGAHTLSVIYSKFSGTMAVYSLHLSGILDRF